MKPSRMNHLNWSRSAGIALTASLVTVCCPAARADWVGDTSSDWNDALNWPDDLLPATNSGVAIQMVGAPAGPTYTATISADSSFSPGEIVIGGWGATGRLDHTAGIATTATAGWPPGWMLVGFGNHGNATYNVADTIIINLDLKQEDIASNIENTNFSLMSFRKNVDVAAFALRERQGERYPLFNFTTSYNYSRVINTLVINDFTLLFNQNKGLTYGFTMSLPIMNGFNNRRNIQQARILVDRQTILYDQQKTLVDVGVKVAFVNYDNAKKVLLIEEDNILVARENLFISLESFKRGVATFIELRTAQQSLADAYYRLINARYLAKIAETELLRLNSGLLK